MTVMIHPKKTLAISFITQYAELVIQFIGVMILARIMSPEEIGIYSVAAFLMMILHVFRDFGIARYVVQEPELTREKIRSAFGVAIILAWSVALLLLLSSSLVAAFYQTPEIKVILIIMSASFAVTPVGSLLASIFRREMQFKKILVVRIISAICHVLTATMLAFQGYGAVSLGWANFAGILSFGIVAIALRSSATPLVPQFKNIREILSFGSIASVGSMSNVAGMNAPDVIIGKVISLAAAGYFSRANGLIQIFKTLVMGSVMPLILPYFAQIRRDKGDLTQPYNLAVSYLTVFAWPFFAVMCLLAMPVVRTLYGPQWDTSVPIVQVLCLAGAISSLATFAGEVMIANGHIRYITVAQMITNGIRIAGILTASAFGLLAIGVSLVISECISLVVLSHYLKKSTGVKFLGVLRGTAKSAIVTCFSIIAPFIAILAWPEQSGLTLIPLVIGLIGALIGWVIAIITFDHSMKQHLCQFYEMVMNLRRRA